jgi:phosphatidate phosphatase APP1
VVGIVDDYRALNRQMDAVDEAARARAACTGRGWGGGREASRLRWLLIGVLGPLRRAIQVVLAPLAHLRRPRRAVTLVAFRGFGSGGRVYVAGRVSEDLGIAEAIAEKGRRARLRERLRMARRLLLSREIPAAEVKITFGSERWRTSTDSNGLFFSCHSVGEPPGGPMWQPYEAELGATPQAVDPPGPARGEVLMRPPTARRLLISDIDDTVVYTGVANKLAMIWRLFATGPHGRSPFPGIAALYRALHAGPDGAAYNPIIYVSRSPWSLYPILEEFFQLHRIPVGPVLLLREWGVTYRHPFPRRAPEHKHDLIDEILGVDRETPVVLIGDSGQRDPEVYAEVVRRHPGRVAAVYIRDLDPGGARSLRLRGIAAELEARGCALVAASETMAMAADALRRGWISADQLREVERDADVGDR